MLPTFLKLSSFHLPLSFPRFSFPFPCFLPLSFPFRFAFPLPSHTPSLPLFLPFPFPFLLHLSLPLSLSLTFPLPLLSFPFPFPFPFPSPSSFSFPSSIFLLVSTSVRPTFEAPYLHNGARRTHGHNGPPKRSRPPRTERTTPTLVNTQVV